MTSFQKDYSKLVTIRVVLLLVFFNVMAANGNNYFPHLLPNFTYILSIN